MKISLRNKKGIAGTDALIAVLIITLFSGIIATFSYNIYLSNASIKRMSKAQGYIVDVFEHIEITDYDDLTEEYLITYFNNKYYNVQNSEVKMVHENETTDTAFKAEIKIEKYNETAGNIGKEDVVEQITMKVIYMLGSKEQVIEMKRIKQR